MSRLVPFLAGVAVTGAAMSFFSSHTFHLQNAEQIDELLKMQDQELLDHSGEIEKIEGLPGRMMLALLACVGSRAKLAQNPQPPLPVAAPTASPPSRPGGMTGATSATGPLPVEEASPRMAPPSYPIARRTGVTSAFFCEEARGVPVRQGATDPVPRWNELVAPVVPQDPRIREYGNVDLTPADDRSFLEERVSAVENLWSVPVPERRTSRFFTRTRGRVFEGAVYLLSGPLTQANLRAHFHFNSSGSSDDHDYFLIYRHDGSRFEDIFENRYLSYRDTHPAWRYNPATHAVSVLGDHCPWESGHDLELKDLYLTGGDRRLIGNIYCRNTQTRRWDRIGWLSLRVTNSH